MSDISVIGLGKMGAALATALLASGRSVTVWNRSPNKAGPLVEAGATLATSAEAAVAASPATVTCLKNHQTTTDVLRPLSSQLSGKAIVDLSTGGAEEAEALVDVLTGSGAGWLVGMINAFPSGIGKSETAILCAGPRDVGTTAAAIPGLFAAMFTARQGFMFGLIYGGAVCRRAGLPMEAFAAQMPVTLDMARNYAETFTKTVPDRNYDRPGATAVVYLAALDDVLATFEATNTADGFPRLMRDVTKRAVESGLSDKELTALVEMLAEQQDNSS
jgi:3-hydroxyisobutyrate dehydrogenase-like beta-hydroxyacid dehydrogenase